MKILCNILTSLGVYDNVRQLTKSFCKATYKKFFDKSGGLFGVKGNSYYLCITKSVSSPVGWAFKSSILLLAATNWGACSAKATRLLVKPSRHPTNRGGVRYGTRTIFFKVFVVVCLLKTKTMPTFVIVNHGD